MISKNGGDFGLIIAFLRAIRAILGSSRGEVREEFSRVFNESGFYS
jgi:hypothetical protein